MKVYMIKCIGKILLSFPKNIMAIAASPAVENLFKVRTEKKAKYLPEDQAQTFHHTTAQILFMCSQACKDIQTEVEFITTRVNHPNEDYWRKLKRLLTYLNGTRHIKLKMIVESMSLIRWSVDALYIFTGIVGDMTDP